MRFITQRQTGFTLIEVLVVLGILTILLTLAIPSGTGKYTKVYIRESVNLIDDYQPIVESYFKIHNHFPENNQTLGLPEPDKLSGNYLTQTFVEDGAIHLVLGNKINNDLQGKVVSLRPIYIEDSPLSPISWICGYDEIPNGMTAGGLNRTDVAKKFLPLECI